MSLYAVGLALFLFATDLNSDWWVHGMVYQICFWMREASPLPLNAFLGGFLTLFPCKLQLWFIPLSSRYLAVDGFNT